MDDLDDSAIKAFQGLWVGSSSGKRISTLSTKQLLFDCGAMKDSGLTYAALILFGKKEALRKFLPQAEIVFEYRSKESAGPAAQREEFRVGFFAIYNRIRELINLRNDKQHYYVGLAIFPILTFNEEVVREALLNAVSHRDYNMAGSIFIRQFQNRLEVENPGGFPPEITTENILNRQSPRNRLIAEIFALSGLVERSGQGVNLMFERSIRDGKSLPDFSYSDEYYVFLTLDGKVRDDKFPSLLAKIGDERLDNLKIDDLIIIYDLFFGVKLSNEQLRFAARLVEHEILMWSDDGYPEFGSEIYEPNVRIVSDMGLSDNSTRDKKLILLHLRDKSNEGMALKALLGLFPTYSRRQMQGLLSDLQKRNLVFCKGKGASARWYLSNGVE
jgi:ATP-dependent DNA helicase RecG